MIPKMSTPLVECVPNFSEGRHSDVITQIVQSIQSVAGIMVLDTSSDTDHNRTVVTFVGTPDVVGEGAFSAIKTASTLINMDMHTGVHPRIGATDVVPFIPLRGVTMAECVKIAEALGERVGDELQIPVYLYEAAAHTPDRKNLADVRRHQYEKLKSSITTDPHRKPDFGPSVLGQAGATAIGARGPLIAFNAYLNTQNRQIAVDIARKIREAGGGLPYVKALGLLVNGQAQVSMNVVDFRQTSLFTIMERLQAEAKKHHVSITHTELVGLVPQLALVESALAYLKLPVSTQNLILENRLGETLNDYTPISFE